MLEPYVRKRTRTVLRKGGEKERRREGEKERRREGESNLSNLSDYFLELEIISFNSFNIIKVPSLLKCLSSL